MMGIIQINLLIGLPLIWIFVRVSRGDYTSPLTTASAKTKQPEFSPTRRHSFRDEEEPYEGNSWRFRDWNKYYEGTNYLGFLFAGKAEFPWIVHIRRQQNVKHSEMYSIGNMVTTRDLLTVCRTVTEFVCKDIPTPKCIGEPDCPCPVDRSKPSIRIVDLSLLLVVYFGSFLNEEDLTLSSYNELKPAQWDEVVGNKDVLGVVVHPLCEWDDRLTNDMAVVTLKQEIPNINRWVGFMPLPLKGGYVYDNKRLAFINESRIICYVATVANLMNGVVHDEDFIYNHKVKFRVYPTTWKRCDEWTEHSTICRGRGCTAHKAENKYPPRDYRIECWETRNRVGAVCDHDRGAPLVCNGTVEGMVIRAATAEYCNAGSHVVFMVQRIGGKNVLPYSIIPGIFPTKRVASRKSSASRNPTNYSIFVFLYYFVQVL